jgi:hypothetical protein
MSLNKKLSLLLSPAEAWEEQKDQVEARLNPPFPYSLLAFRPSFFGAILSTQSHSAKAPQPPSADST